MIQENQLFKDIQSLPPEGRAEVIGFVQKLKKKLDLAYDEKLKLATKLLLGDPDGEIDEDENALWDAVVNSPDTKSHNKLYNRLMLRQAQHERV